MSPPYPMFTRIYKIEGDWTVYSEFMNWLNDLNTFKQVIVLILKRKRKNKNLASDKWYNKFKEIKKLFGLMVELIKFNDDDPTGLDVVLDFNLILENKEQKINIMLSNTGCVSIRYLNLYEGGVWLIEDSDMKCLEYLKLDSNDNNKIAEQIIDWMQIFMSTCGDNNERRGNRKKGTNTPQLRF